MVYEIWHTPSGNALSEHATRAAALDAIREVLEMDGEHAVCDLTLFQVSARGNTKLVAAGADLLRLIEAHVT